MRFWELGGFFVLTAVVSATAMGHGAVTAIVAPRHPIMYLEPIVAILIVGNGVMIGFQTDPRYRTCPHTIRFSKRIPKQTASGKSQRANAKPVLFSGVSGTGLAGSMWRWSLPCSLFFGCHSNFRVGGGTTDIGVGMVTKDIPWRSLCNYSIIIPPKTYSNHSGP